MPTSSVCHVDTSDRLECRGLEGGFCLSGSPPNRACARDERASSISFFPVSSFVSTFLVRRWFMFLRKETRESTKRMKKTWFWYHRFVVFCIVCCLLLTRVSSTSPLPHTDHGHIDSDTERTLEQEQGGNHQIHCSRERSRAAWKIIQEYLMPFVEKEKYNISRRCRFHPDNDIYRDQEQHKFHIDINEWQCGYCKKSFYEEKHLDQHFDNRHSNLLNLNESLCLADVCGALHCDHAMNPGSKKLKCNPAAAARNKHLCESLADSCFPVNLGPAASRLHEFFLHQFCDAHSCTGNGKPFSRGRRKKTNVFYIFASILLVILLLLYYLYIYLYQRGMKRETQILRRISQTNRKKKPS